MPIIHLNKENFDETIHSQGKVLVDFWATWCMPCRMLAPTIEEIAEEMPGVKVCKLDIDESPEIAIQYGVMAVPTVIIFENGEELEKIVGLSDKEEYTDVLNG